MWLDVDEKRNHDSQSGCCVWVSKGTVEGAIRWRLFKATFWRVCQPVLAVMLDGRESPSDVRRRCWLVFIWKTVAASREPLLLDQSNGRVHLMKSGSRLTKPRSVNTTSYFAYGRSPLCSRAALRSPRNRYDSPAFIPCVSNVTDRNFAETQPDRSRSATSLWSKRVNR